MLEHSNLRLLLTNAVKSFFLVRYTFLQKPRSCKRFSISEENCGADMNIGTFESKFFVDKDCKKVFLGWLYFPTKSSFFQVFQ